MGACAIALSCFARAATAQIPKPALDSAWDWGFEGGIAGNGLAQGTVLRRAASWRAWALSATGAVRDVHTNIPGPPPPAISGTATVQAGFRKWRATLDRFTPWVELGVQGSYEGGAPTWSAGPYVAFGEDYFFQSRFALGAALTSSVLESWQRIGGFSERAIVLSVASPRLIAKFFF